MSDSARRLPARPSLEQLQKRAKELLREHRSGGRAILLADAQFMLAREHGFETWAALKRHVEDTQHSRIERYQKLAEDAAAAYNAGDAGAVERLGELFGGRLTAEQVRARIRLRLNREDDVISVADARLFVARLYGFGSWTNFEASVGPTRARRGSSPPFYQIHWQDNSIEPRPPLSDDDWSEIFEAMWANRITGLRAAGQMTDSILERLARLDLATSLNLEGSRRVTDAGLAHVGRMERLEELNLTGCSMTNAGLAALRPLRELREFFLYHHTGVSDEGLAHLAACERLERVDLLGSQSGDGTIQALAGKPRLRHFKSGNQVTDAGLRLLEHFPVFHTWQGGESEFSLMRFDTEPNYLLLRGRITDKGMASLASLEGLFGLNLGDSGLDISVAGLRALAKLPHLGWLGFDATDETMGALGELPRLRTLLCQDTKASDAGFKLLSRSRTLEYLWGRRCYNLSGPGFRAMARMPALRGLSVSCRNVNDAALTTLRDFPALVEFMPMDVPDEGFRHVGRCERLEAIWCMYCRDTGDIATGHLAGLPHLKSYYAGQTRITDRSLEILSRIQTLERLSFEACGGVTDAGVRALAALPRLRELSLALMPGVTHDAIAAFETHVRVNFES